MPELPEAQANRQRIDDKCLNRTITSVELGDNVSYIELPGDNERARLVGRRFTQTHRHGKLIFAGSHEGPWICVHLGMTGKLMPFDAPAEPPRHSKLLIAFEGNRRLAFRCQRKLGWVRVVNSPQEEIARIGFGPDAMEIARGDFVELIGKTRGVIKSALMAQRKLAGIGNLWSDEILFQNGVHPQTSACEVDRKTIGAMHKTMQKVLGAACQSGADYSKLPREWLVRNRKTGQPCSRCDGSITKVKVGGRTAYYCDTHQARN